MGLQASQARLHPERATAIQNQPSSRLHCLLNARHYSTHSGCKTKRTFKDSFCHGAYLLGDVEDEVVMNKKIE